MKKFTKSLIISLMTFGIIAPLGVNASANTRRVRRYHAPVVRVTKRRGQYRRYERKTRQHVTKRNRRYRKHAKRATRLGGNTNAMNQVIARVHNADKSAIMADRSSLEQVKAEARGIAREAKHDRLTKSARQSYLREAHSLYTQANALEAECN